MTVYKIRNPQGLYSTGGTSPRWTNVGKTWTQVNHLMAHLTLLRHERDRYHTLIQNAPSNVTATYRDVWQHKTQDVYVGCEAIELTMIETSVSAIRDGKRV